MNTTQDQPLTLTGRLISAYGDQEPWKEEHDRAMYCYRIEESLGWGIFLFKGLSDAAVRLQDNAITHKTPLNEEIWLEIDNLFRKWASTAKKVLKLADELAAERFPIKQLEDFRKIIVEAECMIGNADFESEIRPIEEIEHMLHPECPRPEQYLS